MWVSVNNNANNLLFPHNYQITTQMHVVKVIHPTDDAYQPIPQYCVPEHISQCIQDYNIQDTVALLESYSSKLVCTPSDPKLTTPSALEVIHRILQ